MRTLILCGGKGTRAYPMTVEVPKPLLEVGGRPILHHLMEIYAVQGFTDFVLATGYKHEAVEAFAAELDPSWKVDVVDTGVETNTGGRVRACVDRMGGTFMLTYADGLGDVDLGALVAAHEAHPGCATLTTVALPSQYGTLDLAADGRVDGFREKPRLADHPINAGYFVMDDRVVEHWPEPGEDLEREVLPALGAAGELYAYRHDGFWKSMDTHKDAVELDALCAGGDAPWVPPASRRPSPIGDS